MASVLAKKQKKKSNYNLKDLKTLGNQLLSSRTHINNLPLLITFISPSSSPQFALESLLSLQSFFIPVLSELPSSKSQINFEEKELSKNPELVYKIWLRAKFDDFVKSLISVAVSSQSDETLKDVVLDAIMDFVKLGKDGRFQSSIYQRFLHAIVYSPSSIDSLLDLLVSKFFKYIDVRYFTYITVEKLARSLDSRGVEDKNNMSAQEDSENVSKPSNLELAIHKIQYILSHIPPFDIKGGQSEYEMWSQSGANPISD
ncbi:Ccaat-binding factor [Thalictrum thalictroides]|uniref:Ccaat-binding factor n=1 Tax=Thalictrum thalictroides TaxID=46969 RepID=A0A7J6VMU2_THATH|nr:Ccaat-binding factor [Thalictrum thalictroides]